MGGTTLLSERVEHTACGLLQAERARLCDCPSEEVLRGGAGGDAQGAAGAGEDAGRHCGCG